MAGLPASTIESIPHLPESPGVYLWRDVDGTVLYVGKAKRLRSRVRSYVASDHAESVKTRALPERPCLDYYIKRCKAPCILAQTQGEYRAMIDEVLVFLEGRTGEVIRRVRDRIGIAVEALDFERAAELRDALHHLERME